MNGYNDDDVQALRAALNARETCEHERRGVVRCGDCDIRLALNTVAPAIVARAKAEALREAAEALTHVEAQCLGKSTCHRADKITLRTRADEIEQAKS